MSRLRNRCAFLGTRLFIGLQYLLPQHLLSRIVLCLSRVRAPWFKNALIDGFLRLYEVAMHEAAEPDPHAYESFNAFFTRALRPGARALRTDANTAVMPADGTVSEHGRIMDDTLIQAKGMSYRASDLLGGERELAARFTGGSFITVYLAPYNYHRVHMPFTGILRRAWHVPGDLFSVNAVTAAAVPGVFARNERVACLFDTAAGPMVVVLVGALFVGSVSLVWAGEVTKFRPRTVHPIEIPNPPLTLEAGAELGRFNMGSTVIVLFAADRMELCCAARSHAVRLGETLARMRP